MNGRPSQDCTQHFPRAADTPDMAVFALDLFADLIAPMRCAACDEHVPRHDLFCDPCSVSAAAAASSDGASAAFEYGGAVASAIMRFKYGGRSDLAPRLGARLADLAAADEALRRSEIVVPVPLHPRRVVERGFDQAALLAKPVARRLAIPWGVGVLERARATPKQATLDRAARLANVQDAFVLARGDAVLGRRVLLVDDVRTTGATLEACTKVLHEGGAQVVSALVIARRGSA